MTRHHSNSLVLPAPAIKAIFPLTPEEQREAEEAKDLFAQYGFFEALEIWLEDCPEGEEREREKSKMLEALRLQGYGLCDGCGKFVFIASLSRSRLCTDCEGIDE